MSELGLPPNAEDYNINADVYFVFNEGVDTAAFPTTTLRIQHPENPSWLDVR